MKETKKNKVLLAAAFLLAIGQTIVNIKPVRAEFNPNFIISDTELTNYSSMNMEQIQKFLNDKDSRLADYIDPVLRWGAAYAIDYFSRYWQINPKYILVLLQKEQSLIEDDNPTEDQLNWATGYGICDGCSKSDPEVQKYKGFVNQVDWGAGGTRFYYDNAEKFKFQTGQTYTIDAEQVTMANDATRALYTYTPHIHGNKNFYNIWQEWFAMNYLNGSLLQSAEDGGIWLIDDNTRHPFLSKSAFLSRYNSFDKVIAVNPADLEKYPVGTAIEYPNYSLLQLKSTGGIYLLDNDTLRPITSKEVFRLLGFNPEEVITIESKDVFNYKIGEAITEKSAYPTGGLLQDKKTGGVYYVYNGEKYPLLSKKIMNLYFKDKKITAVSEDELDKYVTKDAVRLKDGELASGEKDNTVYVIADGEKRPINSAEVFLDLGYKWDNVIKIEDKILALHKTGEIISN